MFLILPYLLTTDTIFSANDNKMDVQSDQQGLKLLATMTT
jgi:hypothetical protein